MFVVDYGGWPIVGISVSAEGSIEELLGQLRDFHSEVLRRSTTCVLLISVKDWRREDEDRRAAIGETLLLLDARDFIGACALVSEFMPRDARSRDLLWTRAPSYPVRIFGQLSEGIGWLSELGLGHSGTAANETWASEQPPMTREQEHTADLSRRSLAGSADSDGSGDECPVRAPSEGSWIVHFDASNNRDWAADMVGALRDTDFEAFLCERRVSGGRSLWLGWAGQFEKAEDAFAARDRLAKLGILLTVSRWSASA